MQEERYKLIFSNNLKYYMAQRDKSQIDIINDLGFNKSAVSTWCNGTRLPRMDKVDALAVYLGVKRSDLIEERDAAPASPEPVALSAHEGEIITAYRNASDDTQLAVCAVLGVKRGSEQRTEEITA